MVFKLTIDKPVGFDALSCTLVKLNKKISMKMKIQPIKQYTHKDLSIALGNNAYSGELYCPKLQESSHNIIKAGIQHIMHFLYNGKVSKQISN